MELMVIFWSMDHQQGQHISSSCDNEFQLFHKNLLFSQTTFELIWVRIISVLARRIGVIFFLDPFDQFTDEEIWNALRQVELADYISSTEKKLDHFLEERGQNFSVGQKQLICLARALLQRNKILVIDEATANVDPRYA